MQRFLPISIIALAGLVVTNGASASRIDFDRYDSNGDGFLSESEWRAIPGDVPPFDSIDTNRDGRLSKAEVEAGLTVEERNIRYDAEEEGETVPPVMSPVSEPESQPRDVSMYDDDHDERVSREEAQKDGELMTYFVIWDRDRDGFLDQEEMDEGAANVHQEHADEPPRDERSEDDGVTDEM